MTVGQAPAPPSGAPAKNGRGRAGRNLPVAIAVGVALGAVVLVTLYTIKPLFLTVVVVAVGVGLWELVRALHMTGRQPPLVPLLAGLAATLVLGYLDGAEGMVVAGLLTAVAIVVWRLGDGAPGVLPDIAAALCVLGYVAFLAGFAVLMLAPEDGDRRVTAFIATVVCADVGGYAAGVLFGRHLMAPSISPKKTWEGFAGSVLACVIAGGAFLRLMFHHPVWEGVLFGLALVASAIVGDLGESLIKRDLGIKDMGRLLPGHGGVMDRLDSLLPSAPVAWLLLGAFVPTPR